MANIPILVLLYTFMSFQTSDTTRFCDFSDPCIQISYLSNIRRDSSCPYLQDQLCDNLISSSWYYVEGEFLRTCPEKSSCGSLYPAWLNGTIPTNVGDIYVRTVCVRGITDCCETTRQIKIKRCEAYLAYCLPNLSGCPSRYCFEGKKCMLETTTATDVATNKEGIKSTVSSNDSAIVSVSTNYSTLKTRVSGSVTEPMKDGKENPSQTNIWMIIAFVGIGVLVVVLIVIVVSWLTYRTRRTEIHEECSRTDSRTENGDGDQYDEIGNIMNGQVNEENRVRVITTHDASNENSFISKIKGNAYTSMDSHDIISQKHNQRPSQNGRAEFIESPKPNNDHVTEINAINVELYVNHNIHGCVLTTNNQPIPTSKGTSGERVENLRSSDQYEHVYTQLARMQSDVDPSLSSEHTYQLLNVNSLKE